MILRICASHRFNAFMLDSSCVVFFFHRAWLHDTLNPIIDKFTSRIQVLTGLSTQLFHSLSHAEELQVGQGQTDLSYLPSGRQTQFLLHPFLVDVSK